MLKATAAETAKLNDRSPRLATRECQRRTTMGVNLLPASCPLASRVCNERALGLILFTLLRDEIGAACACQRAAQILRIDDESGA